MARPLPFEMNGVPVPIVAPLLRHSNASVTPRYAHVADREIEAAAERVGQARASGTPVPADGRPAPPAVTSAARP